MLHGQQNVKKGEVRIFGFVLVIILSRNLKIKIYRTII